MKEYINPSKAYESPVWCYAMIWAAMDIIYGTRRGEI